MKEVKIGTYTKTGNFTVNKVTHPTRERDNTPQRPERPQRPQDFRKLEKPAKKKKKITVKKIIIWLFAVLIIGFVSVAAYRFYTVRGRLPNSGNNGVQTKCTSILNPECWTEVFRPQLKQENGYTNMLIVGLDTRESGKGSSLRNTDSIMVASLNHETKDVMMISIPRDFYVTFKYTIEKTGKTKGPISMKINSVYNQGEATGEIDGMVLLQQVVEEIIGQPIQYRTVVKLQAVTDVVDTFGGIDITIEDAFAAQYPNDNPTASNPNHWIRYEFPLGVNHLDGEKALVYARFRHVYGSEDYELASDFSRGERQQEVIDALKEKALSEDLSVKDKAQKYYEILQTLSKNVETDISFEDILAALSLLDEVDRDPLNIVLDPTFGGEAKIIFVDQSNYNATGYIIRARDKSYKQIQDEIAKIWKYGHFYEESAHLTIINKTGKAFTADSKHLALQKADEPLGTLTYLTQTKTDKTGTFVYDFSKGANPETIAFLKTYFGLEDANIITDPGAAGVTQTNYKEDIQIVVGPEPVATPSPTGQ